MKTSLIKYYLANFNFLLIAIGFPVFTALFYTNITVSSDTRSYSLYYRIGALIISLSVIILRFRKPLINRISLIYFTFFLFSIIRVVYDFYLRGDSFTIPNENKSYLIQYIIGSSFIPAISILFSYQYLNIKIFINTLMVILTLLIIKTILTVNFEESNVERQSLNIAQSTLVLGTIGALLSIIAYSKWIEKKNLLLIPLFVFGFLALGLAGSRGPFIALLVVILIPLLIKNTLKTIVTLIAITILIVVGNNFLLEILNSISPVLHNRILSTINEFDTGGRDKLFIQAIRIFLDNPILGDWFLLDRKDVTSSAHNAIFGAFMSLGIIGGALILIIYFKLIIQSIKLIRLKRIYPFWGLTTIFFIIYSITTGGDIIIKPEFNLYFLIVLLSPLMNNMYNYEKQSVNR